MKRIVLILTIIFLLATPVFATEYVAPDAPEIAEPYMPEHAETFSEGLWQIVKDAVDKLQPNLAEAARVCLSLIICVLLPSILKCFTGMSKKTVDLATVLCISVQLMQSTNSLIHLGVRTIDEISNYGKLLIPVMTSALAAQGGLTTSAALYTGTAFFNTVLSAAITKWIIPMLYVFLVLCICYRAIGEDILKNLKEFMKWLITWSIKILLYLFTGYLGITGVISGTTDAAALKAAKITITGAVPIVGNIISDASESILVSMGVVKNSVGMYGLFVVLAIWIEPFLKIGIQYLLLKITTAVCGTFGTKESVGLIEDFSGIMGMLVAITGTMCLLLLVSIVCFLKGVG